MGESLITFKLLENLNFRKKWFNYDSPNQMSELLINSKVGKKIIGKKSMK